MRSLKLSFSAMSRGGDIAEKKEGLYEDLIDASNINDPVLNDNVSGYTNQQMFNAFSSSITTLQGYRANLLSQNANNQSTQVISLFSAYGY